MQCYICKKNTQIDLHHYDCEEGALSPDTIPLCRRCHRTYHDRGIEWFEDEYLDKATQIENRRREIVYTSLKNPTKPLVLLRREDIKRTRYWYKTHAKPTPKRIIPVSIEQGRLL